MPQLSETTLRQQLADCHRMMVMAELLDYSGHVSARIPGTDRILILPRDASRAGVTPDDMLVIDLDGKVLDGNRFPPTETAIHLGVYRARKDVQAVGHGHPPMSTLFTMVDRPVIAMRNFGFRFIGVPIHPDPTTSAPSSRAPRWRAHSAGTNIVCCAATAAWSPSTASRRCFWTASKWRRTHAARSRRRASDRQADHARRGRAAQGQLREKRIPDRKDLGTLPRKGATGRLALERLSLAAT